MLRSLRFAAPILALASAFVATSHGLASGSEQRPRPDLPIAQLPPNPLPDSVKRSVSELVGTVASARYGINPDSYNQIRVVTRTSAGPLYFIPGSNGACLTLRDVVSCGDPGGPGADMLAVLALTPAGVMAGGGVTTETVRNVKIVADKDGSHVFSVFQSTFVVPALPARSILRFVAVS